MTELSQEDRRQNVIYARIKTKEQALKSASQTGPSILLFVGIILLILVNWMLGVVFLIAGFIWSSARENDAKRIQAEINELKIELQ